MNNKILILLALLLVIVMLFFNKKKKVAVNETGKLGTFSNFTLQTLDGKAVTLSDYQGKVLIVDIWDTWCPPCKKGIPEFINLYSRYHNNGLEILGVALGRQGKMTVQNFIREYGINYTNVLSTESFLSDIGGIEGIPTTFVIDQNGQIIRKYIGYTPQITFERDLRALLGL